MNHSTFVVVNGLNVMDSSQTECFFAGVSVGFWQVYLSEVARWGCDAQQNKKVHTVFLDEQKVCQFRATVYEPSVERVAS